MLNICDQYILFMMKLVTIFLLPILILIILMFSLKNKKEENIYIKNISKKYLMLQKQINQNICSKTVYKKKNKELNNNFSLFKKEIHSNLFVLSFGDNINAKDTEKIKDIISLILLVSNKNDEVLLKLNSSGGFINSYGLAANQIKRLKTKVKLTISVDLIAASGGYLIASVADKIIASSFAIIGSIGVVSLIPNFNKLITKNNIEIEHHTAGEYKSTLNIIGKNTDHGRVKFIESLNKAHNLFKNFIKTNRPILDINKIATGEYWYASEALHLKLIDELKTSDEYILDKLNHYNIYEIKTVSKKKLLERIKKHIKLTFADLITK